MNEEEIRGKVVLPFLDDLGFDLSEISLETSFTIRLGRTQKKIGGRSDILCRRNGKNLFIIELKSDLVKISQKDIDQGISYARSLTGNIAPFTIITNGINTRIFDSVSRQELTGKKISECSDFWKNDYRLSTGEELRIRYEGLRTFISYSDENLRLFCEKQVLERMGPILGSTIEQNAKFVKDLYIQRKPLQSTFDDFLISRSTCFAIVGVAGVGKTNAMCSLALKSLEENFVLFYNAALINKSPLEHIAQDLNLEFSTKTDANIIFKKLDELGRNSDKNVILFIDAVDESAVSDLGLELSEMALMARNLEKIKICISCKSNIWAGILNNSGSVTHLYEELSKFHPPIPKLSNCPGFVLEEFSDDELIALIPIYQKAFEFKGNLNLQMLKELHNGFFIRIFSEVYKGQCIPDEINDVSLIQTYLNKSLEKCRLDVHLAKRILGQIGLVLLRHTNRDYNGFNSEGLDIDVISNCLNFSLNETLHEDLFARNILSKENMGDSCHISFYYSKIRDYVICFHSFKLNKLSDDDFYNLLDQFHVNYIGKSAIEFYLENASEKHRYVFSKYLGDKAMSYVNIYNSYLTENFKNSKHLFDPYTDGEIGIIIPANSLKQDGYALFPLEPGDTQNLRYEDLRGAFIEDDLGRSELFNLGVRTVHLDNFSLLNSNQQKMVEKDVFKKLKDAVEKGKFNNFNSDYLLFEQVALIVYYYQQELGFGTKHQDFYIPRLELIYPINLNDLQLRIYRFLAFEHFKRLSHHTPINMISQQVKDAIDRNLDIPSLNISGDFPPIEHLKKIVSILQKRGHSILEQHFLPYPDISVAESKRLDMELPTNQIKEITRRQFSEDQAKRYVESFFLHLEDAYRNFVDYHFPTLKMELSFYQNGPHDFIFYMHEVGFSKHVFYGLRKSKCAETKSYFKPFDSHVKAFEKDRVYMMSGFHLDDLIHASYFSRVKTVDGLNTRKVDEFCVLRTWIYKLLKSDLESFLKKRNI